ncbi:hypothetical protein M3665_26400, partial [Bacillus licheniformis]|nr:hypothetical protein [Bacillus licheniformis]
MSSVAMKKPTHISANANTRCLVGCDAGSPENAVVIVGSRSVLVVGMHGHDRGQAGAQHLLDTGLRIEM